MDKLDDIGQQATANNKENGLAALIREKATAEGVVYGLIFLFALIIRLAGAGNYPLFEEEAGQAIAGLGMTTAAASSVPYSPLLATLNWLAFTMLGATETTARLSSILCGAALTLLPWGLRRALGRRTSLLAALLLAISPTFIFMSRFNSGAIFAAAGLLLILVNWSSAGGSNGTHSNWPFFAGAVLLFLAAPEGYGLWLVILLFNLISLFIKKDSEIGRLGKTIIPWAGWRDKKYLSGFIVGLVILATTFLMNPAGLGAVLDMPVEWLRRFIPVSDGHQGYFPAAFTLLMTEPFILFAGIFGATVAIWRKKTWHLFFVFSFFALLILDLFMPGRSLDQALLVLLPLLLLAAAGLDEFLVSLADEPLRRPMLLLSAVNVIIGIYAMIGFSTYLKIGGTSFWVPVSSVVILFLLAVLFSIWYSPALSLRSLVLAAGAGLLVASISFGVRLNYGGAEMLPYQPLLNVIPMDGVKGLEKTIMQISSQKAGDAHLLSVLVVPDNDPLLRWEFRDFPNAVFAPGVSNLEPYEALIAPSSAVIKEKISFAGQPFGWLGYWSPAGLEGQDLMSWMLYRSSPIQPTLSKLVLWIKQS